ncbi:hypothetical protein T492DRAFT_1008460 [Pavlovales sp. CCMP2436]|nr:hypothetical protein T492DRAFT_1008460 [Pavlovales sp. CCMP2436]
MEPVWPKPPLCVAGPPMPRMSCGPLMPRMSGGAPAPPPIVSIGPMLTPAGIPLMVSIGPMPPPPPSLSRRRFWTPLLAAALARSEFFVEDAANCTPNPRASASALAPAADSGLAKSRNPTIVFFLSMRTRASTKPGWARKKGTCSCSKVGGTSRMKSVAVGTSALPHSRLKWPNLPQWWQAIAAFSVAVPPVVP